MMTSREPASAGFGLVEVIIAMLLLGLIAVALIPVLWQGISISSTQSATATATRHLNLLVEGMREQPTCAKVASTIVTPAVTDGKGSSLTTSGSYRTYAPDGTLGSAGSCAAGSAVQVSLAVADASGTLASTTAVIYIP